MPALIIGTAHSRFGKLSDETLESLIVKSVKDAIADAAMEASDLDEVYVSHYNSGLDSQGFPASLALQADEGLRFKPSVRVENACASGSAAIHLAVRAIESGRARTALVVGAEMMTHRSNADVQRALVAASYVPEEGGEGASFAGVFAQIARNYFQKYGDQSDALARIAAKNHANGAFNPLAQIRKDLGFEFCRQVSDKNPIVAAPLRRTDCSLVSDGAAALVLASGDFARSASKAVALKSVAHVNDFLPMSKRDMTCFEGAAYAWKLALEQAGMILDDLDFVETHDCFTIAELMQYEAMGLAAPGEGARVVREGLAEPSGKLPVNVSGGLKSKGHPIGATGVSMHVLAARQLCDDPIGVAVENPVLAGVFNMGGAGVANYCSILERCS